MTAGVYETWSEQQAKLLQRLSTGEAVNAEIDWPNIIEEVARKEQAKGRKQRLELAAEERRTKKMRAPRREGRMTVTGWIMPEASTKLRMLSAETGRPVQRILSPMPSIRCSPVAACDQSAASP